MIDPSMTKVLTKTRWLAHLDSCFVYNTRVIVKMISNAQLVCKTLTIFTVNPNRKILLTYIVRKKYRIPGQFSRG